MVNNTRHPALVICAGTSSITAFEAQNNKLENVLFNMKMILSLGYENCVREMPASVFVLFERCAFISISPS